MDDNKDLNKVDDLGSPEDFVLDEDILDDDTPNENSNDDLNGDNIPKETKKEKKQREKAEKQAAKKKAAEEKAAKKTEKAAKKKRIKEKAAQDVADMQQESKAAKAEKIKAATEAAVQKESKSKKSTVGKRRSTFGIVVSAVALTAALTYILTSYFTLRSFNSKVSNVNSLSDTYADLKELSSVVSKNYYENIDAGKMKEGVLEGYVAGLGDKYSRYLSASEYKDFISDESGNTTGIGVTVTKSEEGYILVDEVADGGPAASAKIKKGDKITAVNDKEVTDIGYEAAVAAVKGKENTTVKLTILRGSTTSEVNIKRKSFEVKTVYSTIIGNVGYIRITAFRTATVNQFKSALEELKTGGASSYVFDVRDNGGGLLSALQDIADPLLPEGDIAVADYKDGKEETVLKSDSDCLNAPMVVLVNENTASAAELFACSLRDFSNAKLVGENTYGKGVMQNTFSLSDGGAVTLTIATYKTTKSDNYNGKGLKPDVEVETAKNDDITAMDPSKDAQLTRAINIAKTAD